MDNIGYVITILYDNTLFDRWYFNDFNVGEEVFDLLIDKLNTNEITDGFTFEGSRALTPISETPKQIADEIVKFYGKEMMEG